MLIDDLMGTLYASGLAAISLTMAIRYLKRWNAEGRLPYDRLFAIFFCVASAVLLFVAAALVKRMLGGG